jgi:drug/metabolite transporter (DMT)-like permease
MVLATIGYAIGPLIIQRYLHGLESIGPIAASLTVASLVLLLPAVATWPERWPSTATLSSIAVLGVLCSSIAMLLMFYLVRVAGAARALIITYVNPAVATLLGVGLLHESLGTGGVTAFAVILIGSFLSTRQRPAAGPGERVA